MKPTGYVKGHPTSLQVLDYGRFKVHENGRIIGICGFLIRTSADETVLVDTGFPPKYAADASSAAEEDRLTRFGEVMECAPRNLPEAQLVLAGSALAQVDLMIQTHTHIDHIGGMDLCPQAPILIARAERELDKPLYWGDVQPLDWPDRDYILIERDTQLGPGFRVLLVPGHAPGQLAILLVLPETGSVLLTSDAISRAEELEEEFAGSWDQALACQHGARLMKLAHKTDATLIFGHSPDQWPVLKKAPDAYT